MKKTLVRRSRPISLIFGTILIMVLMVGCQTVSNYPPVTALPPAPVGFPQLSLCIEPFTYGVDDVFQESADVVQTAAQRRKVVVENPSLVSPEIRSVESVYLAQELKGIFTESRFFSNVTVLPKSSRCSDLTVRVEIMESDGKKVKLKARLYDSSGRRLGVNQLTETFVYETSPIDYKLQTGENGQSYYVNDPYRQVLMQVADWVIRSLPSPAQCQKLQNLTVLKYANELAPDIFGEDYLVRNSNGTYDYISLPNPADPFYQAVLNTRSIEMSLYDNFNQYYEDAHSSFDTPYFQWRESNGEAVEEYKRFKRHISTSNITSIMAEVLIVAAVGDWEDATFLEKTLMVVAFLAQFQKDEYGNIIFDASNMIPSLEPIVSSSRHMSQMSHEYATKAADVSLAFEQNTKPISLELGGRTYVLEGKIEDQFGQLAELVQEYYQEETEFGM